MQNWPYLSSLIDSVNAYTLMNVDNSSCYRHRWAGSFEMCGKGGDDVLVLPMHQHLVVNGSQGYSNAVVKCLALSSTDLTGSPIFLTYSNLYTNYAADLSNPTCAATAKAILDIFVVLTDSLIQKYSRLSGVIQTINNFRSSTD